MRTIKVTVQKGKATVEVEGCIGTKCEALTEELIARLGKTEKSDRKGEYFENETETNTNVSN